MSTRSLAALLGTGAVTLAVAACGGSGSSASAPAANHGGGGSGTTVTGTTAGDHVTRLTLRVMGQNLMFNTKTLRAKAGTVRITLDNSSGIGHDVAVQKGTNGRVLGKTAVFSSGHRTLSVHLSRGTYTYFCTVPGHRAAGMVGKLTVS